MVRACIASGVIGGVLLLPTEAVTQEAAGWDPATARAAVEQVRTLLANNYVFPEIGSRYARVLQDNAQDYATLSRQELALRVTADLQGVHQDLHMRLSVGSGEPGGDGQAPVAATPEQLYTPFDLEALPEVGRRLFADEAGRNHYFTKVEILPGNVGYVAYDQFGFPNFSTAAADAAFAFVSETQAIVLDLRNNRGGIEGMNQYIASHFFGDDPVHLYSRYYGSSRTTLEYMSFPAHVARRFPDTPLYVLVSAATGSAAENLAFALQGLERAVVVGEATAGAAHSSRWFAVGGGLRLQLPIARSFNPRTQEDWEGAGVQPDLRSPSASALEVAHTAAIDNLLERASDEERLTLEDAKLLFSARGSTLEISDLSQYTGQFGNRRVYQEETALKMIRTDVQGVPAVDLLPLATDYFTLQQASSARVRFERGDDGSVARMHVRLPTGDWEISEKR